jgi:predicted Zn-dependent protease
MRPQAPSPRVHPVAAAAIASAALAAASLVLLQTPAHAQFGGFGKIAKDAVNRPKFTDEDEGRMAQASAKKVEATSKMWPDPLLEAYVTGIVQKLAAVAEPRPFPYRVRVISDASLNAFTVGGGLLYVHAGLVARLENEAQLAMVLGHEIAHVTERHVTKGIEKAHGLNMLGQAAAAAGSATGVLPNNEAVAKVYQYSMSAAINGHGRDQERSADRIGIDYMVKAGYDPREAPITFELLLAEHGDQRRLVNFFYGSHPANQERFNTLTDLAKSKYGGDVTSRRLTVNTEEFKRATRGAVIATGRLDYESSRFNAAKAMFEKAARAWQDDPVPHHYLGKIALETGGAADSVDAAIRHFEEAIKVDAAYPPAHRDLGMALYRKGDRVRAAGKLEDYLRLAPEAKDAEQMKLTIAELKRYGG